MLFQCAACEKNLYTEEEYENETTIAVEGPRWTEKRTHKEEHCTADLKRPKRDLCRRFHYPDKVLWRGVVCTYMNLGYREDECSVRDSRNEMLRYVKIDSLTLYVENK